ISAESEIFSLHQANLTTRAKDFGADFRSRVLPSVLFTANDYVQATREHGRMMLEMEPLYAKFDAFVTAGMGEAPRIADYRSISFWQKPSLLTAWNVTGQPVLALPNGFGKNGLPLGMQIVGRPFGETTILRVGHAYERATAWHTRHPQLVRGAAAPEVVPPPVLSGGADLGNLTRACDLWGVTSVVRVMDNDYATIYRTLDRGAQAIVVPHVNTRAEAEAVVEAGKFAPLGKRGMFTSRQGFGVDDYFKTANDQSMLMVLIEDIAAVHR